MPLAGFLAATFAFFNATSQYPSFGQWVSENNRVYKTDAELVYRREIYEANVDRISAHNAKNLSWFMAVNKFADLTAEEFGSRFVGHMSRSPYTGIRRDGTLLRGTALPTSVDWEEKGAVTPVKNQQQCGSCWAFSTTGSVEGAWYLAKGELVSLSEQQLVDCSGKEGNQGCNGGLMDYAFTYIINNGGLCSEASYPYTASDGTCKKTCKPVVTITTYKDVPSNSETALLTAIAQQPVSVAVEADQSSFQFYSSGVMTAACGTQLDHGVLAVGYGTQGGQDYYKVKNSWGADWGMQGYILLGRGASFNPSGQCGIQMQPSYPVV